jgi:hypothetical protein
MGDATLLGDPAAVARLKWLSDLVDTALLRVAEKRHRFQRYATKIQLATILFSGAVSLCLGIDLISLQPWLKRLAFTLGVIVTVLNALEPYFNFRALWVAHEEAKYMMHRLRENMDFYLKGLEHEPVDPQKVLDFQRQYQEIWDRVSAEWLARRRQKGGAGEPTPKES